MANRNEIQSILVQKDLVPQWKRITTEPALTKFSRAPLPKKIREELFKEENLNIDLLNEVTLEEVDTKESELHDPILLGIPGMNELAFLQRIQFPINEHHVVLYRSTRFPTPERIRQISRNNIVENAGQERLENLYQDSVYREERERVLSYSPLATALLPQERIVPGLPVFPSVLDALGVHGEFRHSNYDQIIISVFALPLNILGGDISLFYNPPVVANYEDGSHDLEINKFRPYWNIKNSRNLSYRVFPDSAYYRRVFGLQLYEAYLKGKMINNEILDHLGIQVRHFLTDLYGIEMNIKPREDAININNVDIPGSTIYQNIDFLFGLVGGMDALGLERNKATHLPLELQEILRA